MKGNWCFSICPLAGIATLLSAAMFIGACRKQDTGSGNSLAVMEGDGKDSDGIRKARHEIEVVLERVAMTGESALETRGGFQRVPHYGFFSDLTRASEAHPELLIDPLRSATALPAAYLVAALTHHRKVIDENLLALLPSRKKTEDSNEEEYRVALEMEIRKYKYEQGLDPNQGRTGSRASNGTGASPGAVTP